MSSRSGFTLIEILVVIAIIAILAAVLLPVFVAAKARGAQTSCTAHLSQLARAVCQYAGDYNGRPPNPGSHNPATNWCGCERYDRWIYLERGQLWPYVRTRKVYLCAVDWRRPAEDVIAANPYDKDIREWAQYDYPLSYSMNGSMGGKVLDNIRRTSKVMLFIHEGRKTINDGVFALTGFDLPSDVHYDGTTLVYVDTHACWRSYKELYRAKKAGEWDPTK